MRTFVIERKIPGAGRLTAAELQAITQKSCDVLDQLGPAIRWRQSYVTADSVFCIYEANDEATIREHARRGGFPADRVLPVANVMSPATATGGRAAST
jgi:hypothetical protein